MIPKKIKSFLCCCLIASITLTSIPILATEWIKIESKEDTVLENNDNLYYHLSLSYHITWSGSGGKKWSDGAPGENKSVTKTLTKREIEDLAKHAGIGDKTIKNVRYANYSTLAEASKYPDWNEKNFGFWKTTKNNSNKKDFFYNYTTYFAQNITPTYKYNADGSFTYNLDFNLSTSERQLGYNVHSIYRDFRNEGQTPAQAKKSTMDEVKDYLGVTPPEIDFDLFEKDDLFMATFYVIPGLFIFEVEANETLQVGGIVPVEPFKMKTSSHKVKVCF